MCYNLEYMTSRELKYAQHIGSDEETIAKIRERLEKIRQFTQPYYQVSGFVHPTLAVITNSATWDISAMIWGLLPSWEFDLTKAKLASNKTLNARGETMFEKPSFKKAAMETRGVLLIDAFYEHHHAGKMKYPFRISHKSGEPFIVGTLWNNWVNKQTQEVLQSFSIVTTSGNALMQKVHNNPDLELGPRMPLILSSDMVKPWLAASSEEEVKKMIAPYPDTNMTAYTVRRLSGKESVGNVPEAEQEFNYEDMPEVLKPAEQKSLF